MQYFHVIKRITAGDFNLDLPLGRRVHNCAQRLPVERQSQGNIIAGQRHRTPLLDRLPDRRPRQLL